MKKIKLGSSQQQIQGQGGGGASGFIQQRQQKIDSKKMHIQAQNNFHAPSNAPIPPAAVALQKIRKQSTQLILPSINRSNNTSLVDHRLMSASRERKMIIPSTVRAVSEEEFEAGGTSSSLTMNRNLARPQSYLIKKKDTSLLNLQAGETTPGRQLGDLHNVSLYGDKKSNYQDILSNNTERIKFNPWKKQEPKQQESYGKLLVELDDLKKKQKEQALQFQQKQQSSQQSENEPDSSRKGNHKTNEKGDEEKLEEAHIHSLSCQNNLDRNIWKRKKINEHNQMVEECSSIERELQQINFLQNKNQKAISDYIQTQNSLLKLNLQIKKQSQHTQLTPNTEK